jgi:UDP-N-acetylglucosamine 2-epimerase (non-hydrolysing)
VLVHSGQNYDDELNDVFFRELQLPKPDHVLNAVGATVAETISLIISRFDAVLAEERPDAVLLYGDTNSCLGVIAAKRRQIPIFHMEAGNRCFDQRVPEELNRRVVDHLSDVNMTNSEHARRYLLHEGLRPEMVIKTGSPMKEVLTHYRPLIDGSDILAHLGLQRGEYILFSAHREENVDPPKRLEGLVASLLAIAERYGRPVIVSTHPRTRKRLEAAAVDLRGDGVHPAVRFMRPFGFPDYAKLETHAWCVVSDSGTLTEEASLLGFPAVMIRDSHERPEGTDEGVLVFAGVHPPRVLQAIDAVMSHGGSGRRPVPDYEVDRVSETVVRVILSYVDYVNRTVWSRPT